MTGRFYRLCPPISKLKYLSWSMLASVSSYAFSFNLLFLFFIVLISFELSKLFARLPQFLSILIPLFLQFVAL